MIKQLNEAYLINNKGDIRIAILPDYGGALNRLEIRCDGKWINLIDGYKHIDETKEQRFKGVLLAPFPNRIRDGKYSFNNKGFQLKQNDKLGHAIHGFMYNRKFEIQKWNTNIDNEINLICNHDGKEAGFPFPFKIYLTYKMDDTGFSQSIRIENQSEEVMPLGLGWHPYFSSLSTTVNELSLQMSNAQKMIVNDRKIPTNQLVDYKNFESLNKIGEECLDHCFVVNGLQHPILVMKYPGLERQLELSFGSPDDQKKYIQIYTPPDRKSIAIEPMTCAPDVFNNQIGLIHLESKSSYAWKCRWAVSTC